MEQERFTFFWDGHFSQWHPSIFVIDGITYNCAEQFMMAEKAKTFSDAGALALIMGTSDPRSQKAYGRGVKGYIDSVWKAKCQASVYKGSHAKYTQNNNLLAFLEATKGTTLVEASPKDDLWGIGLRESDPRAKNRATWLGPNWLGEELTKLRIALFGA